MVTGVMLEVMYECSLEKSSAYSNKLIYGLLTVEQRLSYHGGRSGAAIMNSSDEENCPKNQAYLTPSRRPD